MKVRPWVLFHSDLPEDAIEDGPYFIQWPGKSVIFAIAELLERCGYKVEEPTHEHEHGWHLFFEAGKRSLSAQVTLIDKYYLIVGHNQSFAKLFGHWPEYLGALERLNAELNKDPRFSEVRWYTQEELDNRRHIEGALAPIDDTPVQG